MYYQSCVLFIWISIFTAVESSRRRYHGSSNQNDRSLLPIHLIGGEKENEGFLGINDNGWNYVCNAFWDHRNSKVVCRELGYTKVIDEGGVKNRSRSLLNNIERQPFLKDEIICEGNERSLSQCKRKPLNTKILYRLCNEKRKQFIKCSTQKDNDVLKLDLKYMKTPLRLHSPSSSSSDSILSSGILQIQSNEEWFDVCIDEWSEKNSNVACSQLGFPLAKGFSTVTSSDFNHFDQVITCNGDELVLTQCFTKKHHKCNNSKKTLNLTCSQLEENLIIKEKNGLLRLRGGFNAGSGRVEIFHENEWGTICDDGWDINDANVVCKQLGFGSAYEATHWADSGIGLGKIFFTNVDCIGNETDIRHCKSKVHINNTCTHVEDAGVTCYVPERTDKNSLRIIGGDTMSGRLEFKDSNNDWAGICGIGFSHKEGVVACRHLGLGFSHWAGRSYSFGITDYKNMFNVKCNGTENSLFDCQSQSYGRCRYYDMASVVCSKFAPDLVMDISTFKDSIKVESHTLYELRCSYEERCLAPIVDNYFYREKHRKRHLLKFTSRILNKGAVSFRPLMEKSDWIYHKCHDHFHSMETFAQYDVIDINGTRVADGHKASFCLEDSECEPGFKKVYNCTDKGDQGISVNCADNYKNTIDCQWVDITELHEGNYSLRVHVNPLINVAEMDYLNNRASCEISYYNGDVEINGCTTDPCYQESFGGNSFGHCCHFPFTYNNTQYYHCIPTTTTQYKDVVTVSNDVVGEETTWCSTTVNYDEDNKWGYCHERIV